MAAQRLADAASIVVAGDRENDIYQAFARKSGAVDLVTRARGDRKFIEGGLLFETADRFRRRSKSTWRPPQTSRARRANAVERPAWRCRSARRRSPNPRPDGPAPIPRRARSTSSVVVAREIGAPAGTKPLMWRLLTTLPVETAEDAREIIRLYRLQWRIEEVFRVLKRDGLALERRPRSRAPDACSTFRPSPSSRRRTFFSSPTLATRAPVL